MNRSLVGSANYLPTQPSPYYDDLKQVSKGKKRNFDAVFDLFGYNEMVPASTIGAPALNPSTASFYNNYNSVGRSGILAADPSGQTPGYIAPTPATNTYLSRPSQNTPRF